MGAYQLDMNIQFVANAYGILNNTNWPSTITVYYCVYRPAACELNLACKVDSILIDMNLPASRRGTDGQYYWYTSSAGSGWDDVYSLTLNLTANSSLKFHFYGNAAGTNATARARILIPYGTSIWADEEIITAATANQLLDNANFPNNTTLAYATQNSALTLTGGPYEQLNTVTGINFSTPHPLKTDFQLTARKIQLQTLSSADNWSSTNPNDY